MVVPITININVTNIIAEKLQKDLFFGLVNKRKCSRKDYNYSPFIVTVLFFIKTLCVSMFSLPSSIDNLVCISLMNALLPVYCMVLTMANFCSEVLNP